VAQCAQPSFIGQPLLGQMTAQLDCSHSKEHPEVSRPEHLVSHLGGSQTGVHTCSHSGLLHDHLQTGVHEDLRVADAAASLPWIVTGEIDLSIVVVGAATAVVSAIVVLAPALKVPDIVPAIPGTITFPLLPGIAKVCGTVIGAAAGMLAVEAVNVPLLGLRTTSGNSSSFSTVPGTMDPSLSASALSASITDSLGSLRTMDPGGPAGPWLPSKAPLSLVNDERFVWRSAVPWHCSVPSGSGELELIHVPRVMNRMHRRHHMERVDCSVVQRYMSEALIKCMTPSDSG
jgi:hypothetical protein